MAGASVANGASPRPYWASVLRQAGLILLAAVAAGALRQFLPDGVAWSGRWPTADTSAEEAYKMMTHEGDPPFVSLAEAVKLHTAGHAVFIDARDAEEFALGRLPGARNLPFYELDEKAGEVLKDLAEDRPLVVYCEGVGCELSLFLGRELRARGYAAVKIFYGGFPEWKNAGLSVEK